ncbi:MAG: hypothetical protein QG577_1181, partial [Thermodesulfobacteriota bacterium]|nr:hypothetical protein [Thermodesulfobacteriota bacterium]
IWTTLKIVISIPYLDIIRAFKFYYDLERKNDTCPQGIDRL